MTPLDLTFTLADSASETRVLRSADALRQARVAKIVEAVLLVLAAIFFALHFVHLKADFPNHSPWMDWAKYTDEGWYGDAAIRHYQLGHWNVPGDFNPGAALPVWPALEMVLFRVTGVSLVAARALTVTVFGLILVCSYCLIRRWLNGWERGDFAAVEERRRSLAPSIATLLLAVSPFCYAISRLAILEPLLILLTLAALLVASSAGDVARRDEEMRPTTPRRRSLRFGASVVALGLLLPLMVLTKTTGLFLFPAIFWLLLASCGYRVKRFLGVAVLACGVGTAVWGGYFLLVVRPRYLIDYRYLFSANAYTGITLDTFWAVVSNAVLDISWIGETLFVLAVVAVAGSLVSLGFRSLRSNPLIVALLAWILGYGAFLTYHANLQPRYYLVLAIPLTMLVAIAFDAVLAGALSGAFGMGFVRRLVQVTAVVSGVALGFAGLSGAVRTLGYVRNPEYGWWSAAQQVHDMVDREAASSRAQGGAAHSRLVLSISGADLSLMTGLQSICDDFGTMTLPDRAVAYRPGWFASWNDVEDDKMDALAPLFHLERVAAIPVFDDPERNLLILYRLDPLNSPGAPGEPGPRRFMSVPRRLRTKVGEQPSPKQLRH